MSTFTRLFFVDRKPPKGDRELSSGERVHSPDIVPDAGEEVSSPDLVPAAAGESDAPGDEKPDLATNRPPGCDAPSEKQGPPERGIEKPI